MDQRNRIRALVVFGLVIISILMLIPTVANLGLKRGEEGHYRSGTPKSSIRR